VVDELFVYVKIARRQIFMNKKGKETIPFPQIAEKGLKTASTEKQRKQDS